MSQNKKLVVGNWKMNPQSAKEARMLIVHTKKLLPKLKKTHVVVCPPVVFIEQLAKIIRSPLQIGIQNASHVKEGAETGEVSFQMVKPYRVSHVIVGHSERRALGESNTLIAEKVVQALKSNITPILCVGELARDGSHAYLETIKAQVLESLSGIPKAKIGSLVIAYEPIWAIGKAAVRVATPEESQEMIIYLKKVLSDAFGQTNAAKIKFLYGGSVDEKNARLFLEHGGVDGFLVGRSSLNPKKFSNIVRVSESL